MALRGHQLIRSQVLWLIATSIHLESPIYRWIPYHFFTRQLEGITSPYSLLIGQYPHDMTLLPSSFYGERCYGICRFNRKLTGMSFEIGPLGQPCNIVHNKHKTSLHFTTLQLATKELVMVLKFQALCKLHWNVKQAQATKRLGIHFECWELQ